MKIDYEKLSEIVVRNQEELDMIPDDFRGRIYIEGENCWNKIILKKSYYYKVVAIGNSSVEAWGNSSVEAWGNNSVVAMGNSSVVAMGNSSVEARGNSSVVAIGNSSVEAWGNSSVVAMENSSVEAMGNSSVEARGNSSVVARGNSSVVAMENSSVEAWGNSSVEAWGNSSVVAMENSSVEAYENVQVIDYLQGAKIKISGNVRIVYMPKNIFEFMCFYGIKHTKTEATFFKAVHKCGDDFVSDYDRSFKYVVGNTYKQDCDNDLNDSCSYGLHIAHLNWALSFGSSWEDIAIIEVETKIDDIILPKNTNGKVRTSKLKVLREIPLEECGLYGKILAKRQSRQKEV